MINVKTALICISLLVAAITAVVVSHVAGQLRSLDVPSASIEYAEGSLFSGRAFIKADTDWQPIWIDANWSWCPSLNPLRWCVDLNGDLGTANGIISTNGSRLLINDLLLSAQSIDMIFAGFVSATADIEANVRSAEIQNADDLNAIKTIDAVILLSNIEAMGFELKNHRLNANRIDAQDFLIEISGEQANGMASASTNGQYSAELSLSPPESIAAMIGKSLSRNPDGSFRYTASGTLPVMR